MTSNSPHTISATGARKRFGAVLREVTRTGGPILIERNGRPVAVILSVQAFEESCREVSPRSEETLAVARSAFGMWANREDMDDEGLERGRARWYSEWPDA